LKALSGIVLLLALAGFAPDAALAQAEPPGGGAGVAEAHEQTPDHRQIVEQRAQVQRQLAEQRRRAALEREAPPPPPGDPGRLSPEQRRQLREQIREAHREWKVGRRPPKG
jgi:hypothetical protein